MSYRQVPTSTDIISSSYSDNMSTSHVSSLGDVFTTENHKLSSNPPPSKVPSGTTTLSTVIPDSLPSLSEPTMTTVDAPATATNVPRIGGKQPATTGTTNISDAKLSGRIANDNLKSDILQDPINRKTFKCVTSTTGIVPVTGKSYSGTNSLKYHLPSPMSRSETAHNSTSTKSTLSIGSSLPTSSSRPAYRRSSSFHSK